MEQSATSRLLVYGIFMCLLVTMAFAFFALTGGSLRPSGTFGLNMADVLYEPTVPESGRRPPPAPGRVERAAPDAPVHREPGVPETPAEEQYYSAIQKIQQQEERQAARLKPRQNLLAFLETPLGRDFRAISELARRGRTAEARQYLSRVLDLLTEQDVRIQAYGLRLAFQIYKAEKDDAGLASTLKRYLELMRHQMSEGKPVVDDQAQATPEALKQVEDMLGELRQKGGRP